MNNPNKKRVYFLILSLRAGGAERQISELYKELPIEKIICLEQGNVYNVPAEKIIFLSSLHEKISSVLKYLFLPVFLYRLYKAIKPDKGTIIISFLERANLLNAISKFFFKNICIQSIRTNYTHYTAQKKIPKLLKNSIIKSYKYADLVIGNSLGNSFDLIDNYTIDKKKVMVINNFYNSQVIQLLSHEAVDDKLEYIFSNYKTITFVSRFDNKKGHLHLIRILKALKNENKSFKLFFIGNGELKAQLIDLCVLLNLNVFDADKDNIIQNQADIYFMGFQKNPYKFIQRSSVFAFPSIFEGLPNALIEAIICNKFCISSDCPSGPREIMAKNSLKKVAIEPELTEYGYLMPPFTGELIFNDTPLNEIEKLWKNIIKQLLQKDIPQINNSKLINRFAKETIINQWENIINNFYKV